MSGSTRERIGAMWDVIGRIITAVLTAAIIGVWVTLNGVTVELARVGERWTSMAERVSDHEARIRALELVQRHRTSMDLDGAVP